MENIKIDYIEIEFLSDTTFSSGYECVGQVDVEIEHDELGLPMLSGKTLHGLLRDGCLSLKNTFAFSDELIQRVFGIGKDNSEKAILKISDAKFDDNTREWLNYAENREFSSITAEMVLESLTSIRTQTSIEPNGTPKEGSLRYSRVANRGIKLKSKIIWKEAPTIEELKCLSISALAVKHAGWERNRGRGYVKVTLNGDLELTRCIAQEEIIK